MDFGLAPSAVLAIACAAFALAILVAAPFTRKVAGNYAFWAALAVPIWLYVFCGRQLLYVLPGVGGDPLTGGSGILPSRLFLLDLCPFYAMVAPPLYLLRSKVPVMVMAPFGLFGALVTLGGGAVSDADLYGPSQFAQYVFLGLGGNQMYFMMHFLSMLLSLATLLWMRGWKAHHWLHMNGFAVLYYGYVLVVLALLPGARQNAAGVLRIDWSPGGEYSGVSAFLGVDEWPLVMVCGYALSYLGISILFWARWLCALVWGAIYRRQQTKMFFLRARRGARKFVMAVGDLKQKAAG